MTPYTLEEVRDKKQIRTFLDLPKKLYKNEKNWICPLDDDVEKRFDPQRNELFKQGDAIRWILRNGSGQAVGRIAAFYNAAESFGQEELRVGGCGFFECIDDRAASATLFDAARKWLEEHGLEAMDGPVNFGDRSDFWGCLVEGFSEPLYCNPYNFPYYAEHFEAYGFKNYFNQHSYLRTLVVGDLNPAVGEKAERLFQTPGYKFGYATDKKLEDYAEDFRKIYNKAWAPFTNVKPIDSEHARKILKNLKPIVDRRLLYFAYYEDEPIGFFIMTPDINQIIRKFNGKLGLWQKMRLIVDLKWRKKADRIFGIIFGVAPEYQGKGIEAGLIRRFEMMIESEKHPYKTMELAWVGDFNPVMMRVVESYVRAVPYKRHVTYRYLFDREREFQRCPRLGKNRKSATAPAE
jgi:GNAT superfamily N-acetyltransferase